MLNPDLWIAERSCSSPYLPKVIVSNKTDLFSWHHDLFISNTSDNTLFKNIKIRAYIRNTCAIHK